MLQLPPCSMPIDGIAWSWTVIRPETVDHLVPFVMAADPSGAEALHWRRDALCWLTPTAMPRGIVSVDCLAGLTLALFFYSLTDATIETAERLEIDTLSKRGGEPKVGGRGPVNRRLQIDRLRWLELARPHRSLDALLAITVECARQLDCVDLLLSSTATAEHHARLAVADRAELLGLRPRPTGWYRQL